MTELEILTKQTEMAYVRTHKLMDSVPKEKWDDIPEVLGSSFSWQVGHLVVSIYYHTIMTTVGHMPELIEQLNLRLYTKLCGYDTHAKEMAGTWAPVKLTADLQTMQDTSLEVIDSLSIPDLWQPIEPLKVPHPVAKTKFEAIDWNVKHTMWHCGQMATIKRPVNQPYDYGLQRRS
ncbi:DinB family protein [Maribacter litopenaei]|uniref:DinB family protein n=1 Tax=Maribacter litopenaei TaxID=2976127 RepID=A0ABY5Y453_9FLAO|nr:DinB family protein [Maribacter litopenaei]UWX53797.1 DinB family protein [Maribacter litopenaei]